jgi:hypothetical protein
MTRDEAIRIGISALARRHVQDHGERCVCTDGDRFGARSAAVIDALIADGMVFEALGPPGRTIVGEG